MNSSIILSVTLLASIVCVHGDWTYSQSSGTLNHNGKFVEKGYAGKGADKNKPESQCVKDQGPLPRGCYSIEKAYKHKNLGPVTMNLEPNDDHDMCERSAFRIHGDSTKHPGDASNGCIVVSRKTRDAINSSADKVICVEK